MSHTRQWLLTTSALLAALIAALPVSPARAGDGTLQISVTDDAGRPLPSRIHLFDAKGKPQFAASLPKGSDHFVCPGEAKLSLAAGTFHYEIERGPEYERSA